MDHIATEAADTNAPGAGKAVRTGVDRPGRQSLSVAWRYGWRPCW